VSLPVFVHGASGLLAGELLRLLAEHPAAHPAGAITRRAGEGLAELHPNLVSGAPTFAADEAAPRIADALEHGPAALVLGLPHGASAPAWLALAAELGDAARDLLVVDLSADFRLADPAVYAATYGRPHPAPAELAEWAYGLPELGRDAITASARTAAPGCFATAIQLACVPAACAGLLRTDAPWELFAVTGSSGSGAVPSAGTHHPHRHGSLKAYGVGGHRHEAELRQAFPAAGAIHLMPHSGPFARGIHLTAALPLAPGATAGDARQVFADAYAGEPFVQVLDGELPQLRGVVGSNRVDLALDVRDEVLRVFAVLDNTIKGGAGQALQCLNLMAGLDETAGLPRCGLGVL
jgi:N-acetyl-gamma-glutamyl-phosphate reductase